MKIMKKKLTLNQAWSKCLRMWKWIAANLERGTDVYDLKAEWLKLHKSDNDIDHNCYFCEYDKQQTPKGKIDGCTFCPGKLVSRYFYCWRPTYAWDVNPKAFYKKLLALHAIYKKLLALNAKRKGKLR